MTTIVNQHKSTALERLVINYWKHFTRATAKKAESKAGNLSEETMLELQQAVINHNKSTALKRSVLNFTSF